MLARLSSGASRDCSGPLAERLLAAMAAAEAHDVLAPTVLDEQPSPAALRDVVAPRMSEAIEVFLGERCWHEEATLTFYRGLVCDDCGEVLEPGK